MGARAKQGRDTQELGLRRVKWALHVEFGESAVSSMHYNSRVELRAPEDGFLLPNSSARGDDGDFPVSGKLLGNLKRWGLGLERRFYC